MRLQKCISHQVISVSRFLVVWKVPETTFASTKTRRLFLQCKVESTVFPYTSGYRGLSQVRSYQIISITTAGGA